MNPPDWSDPAGFPKGKELPERALQNCILDVSDVQGALAMYTPLPSMLVSRVRGHLSDAYADAWVEATRPLMASGQAIHVFNDWGAMEGYDSAARRRLTEWSMQHRTQLRGTYFTTQSRIVSMGIAVAGTALALVSVKLESFTRDEFLARMDEALWQKSAV